MPKERSIHEKHRHRLRERYRAAGLEGFADHEVLELLLGYTILQKDTNPIAHALLEKFGSLREVLEAEEAELTRVEGVGPHTAFFLRMLPDITRRYYEQSAEHRPRFLDSRQMMDYFIPRFLGRPDECIFAAFLDQTKLLMDCVLLYQGSLDAVEVHSELLMKEAGRQDCRYVVLAHNHFTGVAPSNQDVNITRLLRKKLLEKDIGLIDHIIVCGSQALSMQDSGYFNRGL